MEGAAMRYVPRRDASSGDHRARIKFSEWWTAIIYRDGKHADNPDPLQLSRAQLVHHMRSQDNGAHFDKELKSESYVELSVKPSGWGIYQAGSQPRSVGNMQGHLASMRQIGWELQETLAGLDR